MTNTLPILGRLAVITIAGTVVGSAKNVSANVTTNIIKEYAGSSVTPAILESGDQSFKISFGKLHIDGTYLSQVLAGTKLEVIVYPKSTTLPGSPKFTFSNVVLNNWAMKSDHGGVSGEDVSGEGDGCTAGTVS